MAAGSDSGTLVEMDAKASPSRLCAHAALLHPLLLRCRRHETICHLSWLRTLCATLTRGGAHSCLLVATISGTT